MMPDISIWEEPLYRLVLQITMLQIGILAVIAVGIVVVRGVRVHQLKRNDTISRQLFTPLMSFIAREISLEEIHGFLKGYSRYNICLELERYSALISGEGLSHIRALYERLDLRNYGIKLSHSFLWWRRLEGVRLLGAAGGHDIVDVLLESLSDPHAIVRLAAARSLGNTRNPRAIEPLLKTMAESTQLSRRQLAQTLIAFGPAAHPSLRRILRGEREEIFDHRFIAMTIEMLALTGDIESGDAIREALTSPHIEVRIAAFKAVQIMHLPLQSQALETGLADREWAVRAQAALAAGKLGRASIVPVLGSCLSDDAWWVRSNAGQALANCGTEGIGELKRISLESDDRFARDMATRTLTNDPSYNFRSGITHTKRDSSSSSVEEPSSA
ncbi:MAG: HEAT repeat domain-containing protein [Deltaproteobacteria bacterium]|nr:HEAT repeat domain-containing protein [Deltaproteobacteria bacterium]